MAKRAMMAFTLRLWGIVVLASSLIASAANADELQLPADPLISASCAGLIAQASPPVTLEEAPGIIRRSFEQLRKRSEASDNLLGDFDAALSRPGGAPPISQIPEYSGLLAARATQDEVVQRLRDIYFRLRADYMFLLFAQAEDPAISATERARRRTLLFLNGLLLYYQEFEANEKNPEFAPEGLQELSGELRFGIEEQSVIVGKRSPTELDDFEQSIVRFHEAWNGLGDLSDDPMRSPNANQPLAAPAGKPSYCPAPDNRGDMSGVRFAAGSWALTFDDGPDPHITGAMRNLLGSYGLKATFFWKTNEGEKYPDVVAKTLQAGFYGGSHSMTHPCMPRSCRDGGIDDVQLYDEVICGTQKLQAIANRPLSLFRLPYGEGASNFSRERNMIAAGSLIHVHWNVDSADWKSHYKEENGQRKKNTPQKIFERVIKQMKAEAQRGHGGIILFHDKYASTVKAVRMLARALEGRADIRFVFLPEAAEISDQCK